MSNEAAVQSEARLVDRRRKRGCVPLKLRREWTSALTSAMAPTSSTRRSHKKSKKRGKKKGGKKTKKKPLMKPEEDTAQQKTGLEEVAPEDERVDLTHLCSKFHCVIAAGLEGLRAISRLKVHA